MINNQKSPDPTQNPDCCMGSRDSGKAILKDKIRHLRRRADDLQNLHDMLPGKLTPEQDEALQQVALSIS